MRLFLIGLTLLAGIGTANADILTLRNGRRVNCQEVKFKNGRAYVTHENGLIVVPQDMIAKVESGSLK